MSGPFKFCMSSWDIFSRTSDLKAKGCDENILHVSLSVSGLRSRPRLQWLNQWNCSQVTQSSPRLRCIVLCPHRQGGKGDASLWSHCSFLSDAVAAAVQLAWPGTWLVEVSHRCLWHFNQPKRGIPSSNAQWQVLKRKECLCGATQRHWWMTPGYFAVCALLQMLINHLHNKDELWMWPLNVFAVR